jgi:hypothetical protein
MDRNVFNSSGSKTYEAMGLKIFPNLCGSCFSHKCFQMLQISMSHGTLMVFFAPIMNLIKLSQRFFQCASHLVCARSLIATNGTLVWLDGENMV